MTNLVKVKPKKRGEMYDEPIKGEKEYYPEISIDHSTLPAIKDWKVGEEYLITMKVKQVGQTDDKYSHRGSFEIREIAGEKAPKKIKKSKVTGQPVRY